VRNSHIYLTNSQEGGGGYERSFESKNYQIIRFSMNTSHGKAPGCMGHRLKARYIAREGVTSPLSPTSTTKLIRINDQRQPSTEPLSGRDGEPQERRHVGGRDAECVDGPLGAEDRHRPCHASGHADVNVDDST